MNRKKGTEYKLTFEDNEYYGEVIDEDTICFEDIIDMLPRNFNSNAYYDFDSQKLSLVIENVYYNELETVYKSHEFDLEEVIKND